MLFQKQYIRNRDKLVNDQSINSYNRELFKKFFLWEEEKLKRQNGLAKLDEANYKTLCGYMAKLRNVNTWFKNKPWNMLTTSEIKKVYNDLEDGKIKNCHGQPFTDRRSYYNKIFKAKPFKMAGLLESAETALEFFTDIKKSEVEYITEESFRDMVSVLSKPHHLALFWLAWDIGENINSLLQLQKKHFKKGINQDTKEPEYLVYLPKSILKRARRTRSEPTIYPETVKALDLMFKKGKEIQLRNEKGKFLDENRFVPYDYEDYVFRFEYRQALKIFNSVVKRSNAKCEPTGRKPFWTHLRKGMACNLHLKGWSVEDINMRLGHSPSSKWFDSYVNYLAVNRKKAIKTHFQSNLEEVKEELEEGKKRETLLSTKLLKQSSDLNEIRKELESLKQGKGIMKLFLDVMNKHKQDTSSPEKSKEKKFDVVLDGCT